MIMIFHSARYSHENSFALDSPQQVNILKICFATFRRMAASVVICQGFHFVRPNQGCYTFFSFVASQPKRPCSVRANSVVPRRAQSQWLGHMFSVHFYMASQFATIRSDSSGWPDNRRCCATVVQDFHKTFCQRTSFARHRQALLWVNGRLFRWPDYQARRFKNSTNKFWVGKLGIHMIWEASKFMYV